MSANIRVVDAEDTRLIFSIEEDRNCTGAHHKLESMGYDRQSKRLLNWQRVYNKYAYKVFVDEREKALLQSNYNIMAGAIAGTIRALCQEIHSDYYE